MTKICPKCKTIKSYSEFYKNKTKKDGHASICKQCQYEYTLTPIGRANKHKAQNKYHKTKSGQKTSRKGCRTYQKTKKYKQALKKYRKANPEKRHAQSLMWSAFMSGKLFRPNKCSLCGIECTPHGHHDDYSKPLDVIWLCQKCHVDLHWSRTPIQ